MKKSRKFFRIGKVVAYTAMVLSIANLTVYPESHSKYFTAKTDALKYDASLYQLQSDKKIKIKLAKQYELTEDEAYFEFEFDRNKPEIIAGAKKDVYSVTVPKNAAGEKACTFVSVTSSSKITEEDGRKYNNKYTITYTNNDTADTNKILMKCSVPDITVTQNGLDYLMVDVTVREKINKETKFIYAQSETFHVLKSDYISIVKPEFGLSLTLDENDNVTDNFNTFMAWLDKYATDYKNAVASTTNDYDYNTALQDYVKENGYSESTLYENKIPGITVVQNGVKYTYYIEGNLIGYARTHKQQFNRDRRFYFSALGGRAFDEVDVGELNKAFEDYMNTYFSKYYSEQMLLSVIDYINLEGGIAPYIIANSNSPNSKKINGLAFYNSLNAVGIGESFIFDYAYNKINNTGANPNQMIRLTKQPDLFEEDMYQVFYNELPIVYDEDILSSTAIQELFNSSNPLGSMYNEIVSSIIKNNTVKDAFNDYFIGYDSVNKHYLLLNVYSTENDAYVYIKLTKLEDSYTEEEKENVFSLNDSANYITFINNSDNTLSIKINYLIEYKDESKESYKNQVELLVSSLEKYFNGTLTTNDTLFEGGTLTDENGVEEYSGIITYTLNKK